MCIPAPPCCGCCHAWGVPALPLPLPFPLPPAVPPPGTPPLRPAPASSERWSSRRGIDCGGDAEAAAGRRGVWGVFSFMLMDQTDPAVDWCRGQSRGGVARNALTRSRRQRAKSRAGHHAGWRQWSNKGAVVSNDAWCCCRWRECSGGGGERYETCVGKACRVVRGVRCVVGFGDGLEAAQEATT